MAPPWRSLLVPPLLLLLLFTGCSGSAADPPGKEATDAGIRDQGPPPLPDAAADAGEPAPDLAVPADGGGDAGDDVGRGDAALPDGGPSDAGELDGGPSDAGELDSGSSDAGDLGPVLPPLDIPPGCNPLAADQDCLLPFPSDVFLVDDPARPGGRRLALPEVALPRAAGQPIDFTTVHPADGFSVLPPILALLPASVSEATLTFHDGDVHRTLQPGSTTLILEAASGEPVLHFAELDPRAAENRRRQALVLRPMVRLKNSTRYVVALHGLRSSGGALLAPPEGFRRLRDQVTAGDPVLAPLAARYERDVFPVLAAAGLERDQLQLAWDFTTGSREGTAGDLLAIRADLLARLEATPPPVAIDRVDEPPDGPIFRRIEARMTVPLYLEQDVAEAPLNRDEQGRVVANGSVEVPFTVQIPRSVAERRAAFLPARVLQFGHGFFGYRNEGNGTFLRDLAEQAGFVIVAADWWGMTGDDVGPLMIGLGNRPSEAFRFIDRVHQGLANYLALGFAVRSTLAQQEALQIDGQPAYDPQQLYFYGISQGHILGGTFLALSPHVARGVLSSGGCAFSFMMFRSWNFNAFLLLISQVLPDPLDQQKFAALCQTSFDRIDPVAWAPHVLAEPLPGSPAARQVLMQLGIGDTSVPGLAGHLHARSMGLTVLEPAPRPIPGMPTAAAPFDGSALAEYDFGLTPPLPGDLAIPPVAANEVHEAIRRTQASMRQIDAFLRPDGRIESFCDGVCDPE